MNIQGLLPLVGEKYSLDYSTEYNPDTGHPTTTREEFLVLSVIPRSSVSVYVVGVWNESIRPIIMSVETFNLSHPLIVG